MPEPSTNQQDATAPPAMETASPASRLSFSRLDLVLLVTVLLFYSGTRVIGIVDFPIFFFCDEATHGNLARELVDNGLRDNEGRLFPPYFRNAKVFNLGLSVWIHAASVAVFGTSVAVVRLTSVAIGVFGAAALMLVLKIGFKSRLWWTAGLVLAAFPGWFLHSRTAFETVMMVSFYAGFMLAYLLYREISPRWLPVAILLGGATFYSYSNGQGVMFLSGLLLLISDAKYHWKVLREHRAVVAVAILTAVIVASPYLRFRFVLHPEMVEDHLADLHSYWLDEISTQEKVGLFFENYGEGLDPRYWFAEDEGELVRHRMQGYGYLPIWLSPVILLGAGVSILRAPRSAAHRLLVIAVLAAPFSAALVDIRITRVLAMMAPAAVLAVLGLDCIFHWIRRWMPTSVFATVAAVALVTTSTAMTADALRNGPTWYRDYGMGGLQWGASQLFAELERRLEEDPRVQFVVSHSWANLPNAFVDFYLEPRHRRRVGLAVIDDYVFDYQPNRIGRRQVFVLTPHEHRRAIEHEMFDVGEPEHVIHYPDGEPGFIFARIEYSAVAGEIFDRMREERRRPVSSTTELDGVEVAVSHPRFDVGTIDSVFDGDLETIARTLDADPSVLVFELAEPRSIAGVRLNLWTPYYDLRVSVESAAGEAFETTASIRARESFSEHELRLAEPVADAVRLTIVIDKHGDTKAHIQEIAILP